MRTKHATVGVLDILLILFIGLKLAGAIDWSWWWVLSPFWGMLLVAALLAVSIKLLEFYADK